MLECMREYFENKADRLTDRIKKLHEVGYDVVYISNVLGLPESLIDERLEG